MFFLYYSADVSTKITAYKLWSTKSKMAAPITGLVSYSDSDSDISSCDEISHEDTNLPKRKRKLSSSDEKEEGSKSTPLKSAKPTKKPKERLPVPDGIARMFNNKVQHVDNQEEHDGRIRTFAHERGNWASYVYADVDADSQLFMLANTLAKCLRPHGEFIVQKELHLSLSRTFVIRHHWIDSFLTSIRSNLEHHSRCTCVLSQPRIYCNDEKTRTFLGIEVVTSSEQLKEYVKDIDKSLEEFRLPVYYKDPSFHVSLAWATGDVKDKISEDKMEVLQMLIDDFFKQHAGKNILEIDNLKLKTGNKVFLIPLAKA